VTNPTALNQLSGLYYDAAGNVLNDGKNYYLYDPEGRLCAVAYPNGSGGNYYEQYLYDAGGTRVGKTAASSLSCAAPTSPPTTQYLLGLGSEQVTELSVSGTNASVRHSNVFVGGGLLATYDFMNGGLHFALSDPLGTRRVQVTGLGTPELNFLSLPFGNNFGNPRAASSVVPPGALPAPDATEHHFTGKERDTESGNDYFEARYYSSAMGRFMSPDWSSKEEPIPYAKLDNPQSLNLYSYVYNNPLSKVDPDGHLGCGFLWLGDCPKTLAPPPPPPAPPALAIAGTPPSNLADAQKAARNNPANQPTDPPDRKTFCNQATCQIAKATNAPTDALLDPKTGLPNLANTDARTLANSPDWGKVSPQTAQDLATLGVTVLGVRPEDPHGHIVSVAPEMIPGDQNVKKYGPLINNIGGTIGVTNANNIFRGAQPTYYALTTPQW